MSSTLAKELLVDETTALDYKEIKRLLSGRVPGLKAHYVDLETFRGPYEINKFLPSHVNCCFVLLSANISNRTLRHWSVLVRHARSVDFFESLGMQLASFSKILTNGRQFVDMIKRNRMKLNTKKLQDHHKKIKTCGIHAAIRAVKYKLTVPEYVAWLLSAKEKPDVIVSKLGWLGLLNEQF